MSVVIATAGHVDHGKSTLVRALTGMDPDRLESERSRGLTIELGFAWAQIGGETVAFVDVPGHEKFITTMLSGIGAVPLALLVVAADDPWMPQAAEHLAALDALGVSRGVVAITRSDLADPAAATDRARTALAHTSLRKAPIVPVSAVTGDGMDSLRSVLATLATHAPAPPALADVRVWVDRKFTVKGSGTVVTGTLPAGTIAVGDELSTPHGPVRVRGIESLNSPRERVSGSARVALNLTGATKPLRRGDPLWTPGHWCESHVADVRLRGRGGVPPRHPMWHIGAYAGQVRLRMIDEVHAQISFDTPVPLRQGDQTLLRDPGDRRLWGVTILDPDPAPLRGRGVRAQRSASLRVRGTTADYAAELASRGLVHSSVLRKLGITDAPDETWHVSDTWRKGISKRIDALVRAHDRDNPARPGLAPAELLGALGLDPALPTSVLTGLLPEGLGTADGRITSTTVELPPRVQRALDQLAVEFADAPFGAPTAQRLRELGLSERDLGAAARLGRVFLPAPGVVLSPAAPQRASAALHALPQPFTTSQAREALGTSRRVAIPLLDFLDRARVTRRLPDDRRELL